MIKSELCKYREGWGEYERCFKLNRMCDKKINPFCKEKMNNFHECKHYEQSFILQEVI